MLLGKKLSGEHLSLSPDTIGRHLYIVGASGSGKSTLLENCALSLIEDGYGLAFLDRHGDSVHAIADRIPAGLTRNTILWEPFDTAIGFNPLSIKDTSDKSKSIMTERVTSALLHAWNTTNERNFYTEMEEKILRNTIRLLLDNGEKLTDISKCLLHDRYRRQLVGNASNKDFWNLEYKAWNDKQRVEYTASLSNKVDALLSSPIMTAMLSHDTLSIDKVMDEGKVLLVDLSIGKMGAHTSALTGSLLTAAFSSAALSRTTNRRPFVLMVDEFAPFANPAFRDILSEARKFGLSLVLAHQYPKQIPPYLLDAVLANCATVISFRLGADVDALANQLDLPNPRRLRRLADYHAIVSTKQDGSPVEYEITTFDRSASLGRIEAIRRCTASHYGRE